MTCQLYDKFKTIVRARPTKMMRCQTLGKVVALDFSFHEHHGTQYVVLHFGDEATNQLADNEIISQENSDNQNGHTLKNNLITEHDLREQMRLKETERLEREMHSVNSNSNGAQNSGRAHGLRTDKNKGTKCIKVKKMSHCTIS